MSVRLKCRLVPSSRRHEGGLSDYRLRSAMLAFGREPGPHVCPDCDGTFGSSETLELHVPYCRKTERVGVPRKQRLARGVVDDGRGAPGEFDSAVVDSTASGELVVPLSSSSAARRRKAS